MEKFRELIDQKVKRLFLIVSPPICEELVDDIDMSVGFVFEENPDVMTIVSIEERDLKWIPYVYYDNIPLITRNSLVLNTQLEIWKQAEDICVEETQYYELTEDLVFKNIVNNKVQSVEIISVKDFMINFGVKILFEDDYVISTPITDGNTVETSQFNINKDIIELDSIEIANNSRILSMGIQVQN